MDVAIHENKEFKIIKSSGYNFEFNKKTGEMKRWGKTYDDDPQFSFMGPEILDLEISSSVTENEKDNYDASRLVIDGGCKGKCPQCYKNNGAYPTYNMTFAEFVKVFHTVANTLVIDNKNKTKTTWISGNFDESILGDPNYQVYNCSPLTQIAFGIMNMNTNPDFFKMARYSRKFGVAPNFTMHGLDEISDEYAKEIVELFGACAVSVYDREKSYNTIKKMTDAAEKYNPGFAVNIHAFTAQETLSKIYMIINDYKTDSRLAKLNAIVLLSLKQKGGGAKFTRVNDDDFEKLVKYMFDSKTPIGFDSCTANKFIAAATKVRGDISDIINSVEPCESNMFSSYINCKGEYYPCSFAEGCSCEGEDWTKGISVIESMDFLKDVWTSPRSLKFRESLTRNNRSCPIYNV